MDDDMDNYMNNHANESPLHLTYLMPLFLLVDRYVSSVGAQEQELPPRTGEYVHSIRILFA